MIKKFKVKDNLYTIICFAVNILVLVLIFLFSKNLPPQIPLLYGKPTGEEQLVSKNLFFIPSAVALLIGIVNTAISKGTGDEFIKSVMSAIFIVATIFSTIAVIKITFLVGSF